MNENFNDFFKGKRITVIGLGLLGRGVGDALFLARCGAEVLVTDKKSATELAPSVARLKRFSNIRFHLGGHNEKDFRNADMVIKAAGVPLDSPYIKEARKNKVPVCMSTALFVKLLPPNVTVIGITGTRGKTTTTHLIYEVLNQHTTYNIQHTKSQVFLGGNVQGVSTLAMLPKVKTGDFVVLELDSWQLQGFRDLKMSPHIAVFTTFFPDHMNYYGGDMDAYLHDKAYIFRYQKKDDFLILGTQAAPVIRPQFKNIQSKKIVASVPTSPIDWTSRIPGEHNRANIACAVAVADALGVPRAVTKKVVESFRGVPGRLELIREIRGVKIYNDTTATTPDATIAALRALAQNNAEQTRNKRGKRHSNILKNVGMSVQRSGGEKRNIILIMGGADKGLDMSGLVKEIPKWCKAVVLLSGSGTDKLTYNLKPKTYNLAQARTLKMALNQAIHNARNGDIILFSPAFASFGMFRNEYDRGEKFVRLVRRL